MLDGSEDRDRPVVVHVLRALDGGPTARHVVDLARRAAVNGFRAVVLVQEVEEDRDLLIAGVRHERMLGKDFGPLSILANGRRLRRFLQHEKALVVHAHDPFSAWCAGLACKQGPAVLLATCHGVLPGDERGLRRRVVQVLAAGERLITTSEHLADRAVELFALEPERVRAISAGVDLREFDPDLVRGLRVAAVAERCAISVDDRILFVPGPIDLARGHGIVLDAVARCRQANLLTVFGSRRSGLRDGDRDADVQALEERVRARGLGDRVRWVDEDADLPALLKIADAVALVAPQPLPSARSVLAAQAMGKPVIVSNNGALPELMMPGSTGWMVDPRRDDEVAHAIDQALALEDGVRERLATRARDFVAEHHDVDRSARRVHQLYREVLRRVSPTPARPVAELARS